MERITVRGFTFTGDYIASNIQRFALAQALNKLQKYEDAEEDNRLWEAPCPMGTTLYMIVTKRPKITHPEFSFIKTTYLTENNFFRVLREFGKTVFLTREEAEARMKESYHF